MAYIDPNLIQKYLTISADVIKNKLVTESKVKSEIDDRVQKSNIILLDAAVSTPSPIIAKRELEPPEAMLSVSRQHELMNPTCLPTTNSCIEMFASEQAFEFPFAGGNQSVTKAVDNRFDFGISFVIPYKNKLYKFKASDVNANFNRYFTFVDFSIKNSAKDIFTARSTFQIELQIAFTDLSLLLEKIIPAVDIEDPTQITKFSIINLIYRFASAGPIPLIASSAISSARDKDGVYIIAELSPKEDAYRYYQNVIQDLNPNWNINSGNPLLSRTFHCTYHKHEINMGGDPSEEEKRSGTNMPKSNMLTINLVSYEMDSGRKDSVSSTTVSQPDNLYDLINSEKALDFNNQLFNALKSPVLSGFSTIKQIKKLKVEMDVLNSLINQNQSFLACIPIYEELKTKNKLKTGDFPAYEQSNFLDFKSLTPAEAAENVKKEIEKIKNEINLIKFSINKSLAWFLLSQCSTYKLTIPYNSLQTFDDTQFIKSFTKNFSAKEFLTSTATGALFGAGGGLAGSGIGAASSAAFYTVQAAIKSALEKEIITKNLEFINVRNAAANGTIEKCETFADRIINIIKNVRSPKGKGFTVYGGSAAAPVTTEEEFLKEEAERSKNILNGESDSFNERQKNLAKKYSLAGITTDVNGEAASAFLGVTSDNLPANRAANIEIQKTGVSGNVDIQFILFGDLLSILTNNDTFILLGGKPLPKEEIPASGIQPARIISEYLNFYYYPINLQKFYNFIHENILKRPEPNYSTEVFIKDIFDRLIRQPLMDGEKNIDETFNKIAPTYLVAATSTHYDNAAFKAFTRKDPITGVKQTNFINLLRDTDFFQFKKNFSKSKFVDAPINKSSKSPIKKIITFFSDEQIKYHDFYLTYDGDKSFGASSTLNWPSVGVRNLKGERGPDLAKLYDNQKFEEFINQRYFIPCIAPRSKSTPSVIQKSYNITFTRIDNPDFTTGNIIDSNAFLRLPYNFSADFFPHLSFFLDVGSHIFIQPAKKHDFNDITSDFRNSLNLKSQFGMAGLYVINKSAFYYKWPLKDRNGKDTKEIEFSRQENKYTVSGILVSYGDSYTTKEQGGPTATEICSDVGLLKLR